MFIETFSEWKARMGCEVLHIGNRFLAENGGYSDGTVHHDPPDDFIACLKLQRQFWQYKLDTEVRAFEQFRAASIEQAQVHKRYPNLPPPDPTAHKQLEAGKKRIAALRKRLKQIDDCLADTPEARRLAEAQERELARRESVQEHIDRLTTFRL